MNDFEQFVSSYFTHKKENDISINIGVELFLSHVEANKSPSTYVYYKKALEYICDFFVINHINYFNQINASILDSYVLYERNRGCCNNTINKRIGAIKTCSSYLANKLNILNDSIQYDKLKVKEKEIQILTNEELTQVYNYLDKLSLRDHIIVLLIMQTGIRRTECSNILRKYTYVDENKIYLFHTKTNQPRYIFFDDETANLIRQLLKQNNSRYLFSLDDNPLSPNVISHIFIKIKKDLGIKKSISPHKFRHTFATTILSNNGGNMEDVRILLGHSSYDMTKKYLHMLPDHIKRTSLAFNPVSAIKSLK